MIRYSPTLILNRLRVEKGGRAAYDEKFRAGVNMIRSEGNSRGKSSIADLIFFSLGGDLLVWKDEAASCDQTLAEVSINGTAVTLRREIDPASNQRPMFIHFGSMESAFKAGDASWQKLAYRRHLERESFTQVLFRTFGISDVPTEESNITMHQLLRLMYVDQMTPVNRIFRSEAQDAPLRRQAVGDLMCGVLDDRIYPAQIRLRQTEKEHSEATTRLSSLLQVLRRVDQSMDFRDLLSVKTSLERERLEIEAKIENLRSNRFSEDQMSDEDATSLAILTQKLKKDAEELRQTQLELEHAQLEIEDSNLLISEIERSLHHLRQAIATSETLGKIDISYCPSCFSPVEPADDITRCHLCKSPIDPDVERAKYLRMQNEFSFQLKESTLLREGRLETIRTLQARIRELTNTRDSLSAQYRSIARRYTTKNDAEIELALRRLGFLDRELIDLEREQRVAAEVAELSAEKERLNEEIQELRQNIAQWISDRKRRQSNAYQLIAEEMAKILSDDTKNDIGSVTAEGIYFNFTEDRMEVNEKSGFSASSLTVIRNAFHLALLAAACRSPQFKYPRFLLMDNVEDKGMTPERSKNFQRLIVETSEKLKCEHQIIFTTSMPEERFEEAYGTGERYTESNMSLKV